MVEKKDIPYEIPMNAIGDNGVVGDTPTPMEDDGEDTTIIHHVPKKQGGVSDDVWLRGIAVAEKVVTAIGMFMQARAVAKQPQPPAQPQPTEIEETEMRYTPKYLLDLLESVRPLLEADNNRDKTVGELLDSFDSKGGLERAMMLTTICAVLNGDVDIDAI